MELWQLKKVIRQSQLILDSYRHWKGAELFPEAQSNEERSQCLFIADFIVISHGVETDPVLNYGNQRGLELWEMTWDSFIQTPSRLTAEIMNRPERAELLEKVNRDGFSEDYRGIRISGSGRRFEIESAMVWNLLDARGHYAGQAASFEHYHYLD